MKVFPQQHMQGKVFHQVTLLLLSTPFHWLYKNKIHIQIKVKWQQYYTSRND